MRRKDGPNSGFKLFLSMGVRNLRGVGPTVCVGNLCLKIGVPRRERGGTRRIGGLRDVLISGFTLFALVGVRRFLRGCAGIISPLKVGEETEP